MQLQPGTFAEIAPSSVAVHHLFARMLARVVLSANFGCFNAYTHAVDCLSASA